MALRLSSILAVVALFVALLQSSLATAVARQQVEADIGGRLFDLSYHMAEVLDRGMFERYRDIQILATLEPIRDPQTPQDQRRALLETLQRTYPDYAWIGLTDPEGMVLVSTGQVLEGANVAQRPWFQNARSSTFVGDVHDAVLLAQLLPNPDGEPLRFVDVALPVYGSDGVFLGVLGAHLSWSWAREVRESVIEPVQNSREVEVIITRADGQVVLGPQELIDTTLTLTSLAAAQKGQKGVLVERWPDDVEYLVGYTQSEGYRTYPGLGWVVLVREPVTRAFAPAAALQNQIVFGLLTLAFLLIAITGVTVARATRPLRHIAQVADRLRAGDTSTPLPVVQGEDEIARLSYSFKQLVSSLLEQEQRLARQNEELERELVARSMAEVEARTSAERANQLAVTNARSYENARRRLSNVQALRRIDLAITTSRDLPAILQICITQVVRELGVDAAMVHVYDSATDTLRWGAALGLRVPEQAPLNIPVAEAFVGRAFRERRRISMAELIEMWPEKPFAAWLTREGFITYYGVPLVANGEAQGVLEVFHRSPLNHDDEWFEFLETLAGQIGLAVAHNGLFTSLTEANAALVRAYDTTIEGWSRALDLRDKETEGHSQRVTALTLRLATILGVPEEELIHIRRGALLHDIGKMGVPDQILLKPGKLDPDEWAVMQQHPLYAYQLLSPITYLQPALAIPYSHHEKWDGTGYPQGLQGEQIPLAARIFAVIDVWDALTSDRPYRAAWTNERALAHIVAGAGSHFDPAVVAAFEQLIREQ